MFDLTRTVSELDQALAVIALAAQDPARTTYLKTELSKIGLCPPPPVRIGAPPPLPAASTVTAVQVAIFDNKHEPYGGAVEVWDCSADEVRFGRKGNFEKVNFTLLDRRALKGRIRDMKRANRITKVDPDYIALLETLADGEPKGVENRRLSIFEEKPNTLVGLMQKRIQGHDERYDAGNYYFPFQFIIVEMVDGHPINGRLMLTDEVIHLGFFDDKDSAGRPHGGNVIAQSRTDLCGFSSGNWATNEVPE